MILLNRRKYIHRRRPQGAPADLADAVVTLASETVYYTGNPVYPSVSVTYEGAALIVNTDYNLNYTDNTEIGAATVTVTGMGEYTGSVVKTFQIVSSAPSAGWSFDVMQIPDSPTFASFTNSGYVGQICPAKDPETGNDILLVATGTGHYVRSGTWSGFDPSTWVQTGTTSGGVNSGTTFFTPDGIHYLLAPGGNAALFMHMGTDAYDVTTIAAEPSSSFLLQSYINGASISSDGLHILISSSYGGMARVTSYDLQTAWDLSSVTNMKYSMVDFGSGPIYLNPNDPKMFVVATSGYVNGVFTRTVSLVTLENEWDASAVESVSTKTLGSITGFHPEAGLTGIVVNEDGSKMVLTATSSNAGYAALVTLAAASGGSWDDIDLSNLGNAVASATISDSTAQYHSNTNLSGLGIQTLPDDSIFFIAPEQGHAYIWGFDDGHAFEVGHFKSTYTSRSRSVSNYKGGTLGNSGTLLYDYNSSEGTCKTILDTAYQLSTENSRSLLVVSMGIEPMRMQFSYDGRKLFYRGGNEATTLYYTDLSTPWDLASKGNHSYIDLSSLSNLPFDSMVEALAFLLSPDGKTLLFTCSGTASQVKKQFLIKLSLSTAYDLTTASVHSYKQLSTGSNWWQGVAVNSAATKMLLHLWNNTTRVFYEYDLTASA